MTVGYGPPIPFHVEVAGTTYTSNYTPFTITSQFHPVTHGGGYLKLTGGGLGGKHSKRVSSSTPQLPVPSSGNIRDL